MKVLKFTAVLLLAVGMFSTPAIAQNDDCATADSTVPLTADPCADLTARVIGPGTCNGRGGGVLDQWVSFVATSTAHRIRTDIGSVGTDSNYVVYSGTCPPGGTLTEVGCSEDEAPPWLGNICVSGLTPTATYYIQVGTWADGCPNGPYVVDVFDASGPCGDGVVACSGESCDDGNLTDGDGCDSNCTPTGCGNGILTAGEVCDDGNLVDGDGCDSNCTPTGCGNGVVTTGEECDDGNTTSGDGCSATCVLEGVCGTASSSLSPARSATRREPSPGSPALRLVLPEAHATPFASA